jgi:hypothetical protein
MRTLSQKFWMTTGCVLALAVCFGLSSTRVAHAQATNNDSALQSSVADALSRDPVLKNQPVTASIANGVVTLTGSVETEQQRQQAETDAANVQGVSGIQNNITVTGPAGSSGEQQAPPPPDQEQAPQQNLPPPPPDQPQQPSAVQSPQSMPPPPPPDQPTTARAPYAPQGGGQPGYGNYPPPQPASGPVTIPAGTLLQIRISEPLDVSKIQDGAVFQATAASDVFEGNVLAIPRGAVLQGTVVHVKRPGSLGGNGELQLQVNSVDLGGQNFPLTTDLWSSKGPNKAGYTAGNTVGGAVVGALIGGLIGRGPGAAAGAIVGGGAGMAASAATNGPRIYLPAESLLNFHLSAPVTVQPVSWQEAQRLARNAPQLVRRPVYRGYYPYPYPYPYPYRVYGYPYPY